MTFSQFPREHWPHLRMRAAKRFKKVENVTALIWKMLQVAESTFRRRKGAEVLLAISADVQDTSGEQKKVYPARLTAACPLSFSSLPLNVRD